MLSERIFTLDGGLGSTLEDYGYDVEKDPLWSAKMLDKNPLAIVKVRVY